MKPAVLHCRTLAAGAMLAALFIMAGCGGTGIATPGPAAAAAPLTVGEGSSARDWLTIAAAPYEGELPDPVGSGAGEAILALGGARAPHGGTASVRWNGIARALVAGRSTSPIEASRLYALLSVANCDALVLAWRRASPLTGYHGGPAEQALVASSSATVLASFYPNEEGVIQSELAEDLEAAADVWRPSDVAAARQFGRAVALRMLGSHQNDGYDAVYTGAGPVGPGYFTSTDPVGPLWGEVKPWLLESGSQLRPGPPPAWGSVEFVAALSEVRQCADTRTPEQLQIALYWDDGPGTFTAAGRFNLIACDLLSRQGASEVRAALVLAYLNIAQMDACIAVWDAKYTYWLVRPYQADPDISVPIFRPQFPAYPSGHCGFSGAAETVLGYFFPSDAETLRQQAYDNCISRLYGGVHYRFDLTAGMEIGRAVGALAVERARLATGG